MKEIKLTQGRIALVDDEDCIEISKYKWMFNNGYASRQITISYVDGRQKQSRVYMHRVIVGHHPTLHIDHIDGNPLNNQKYNLRLVTAAQNQMNRKVIGKNNKSGYKGVYRNPYKKKPWSVVIGINKEGTSHMKFLGNFVTPREAALVYDNAAKEIFGKYAKVNL